MMKFLDKWLDVGHSVEVFTATLNLWLHTFVINTVLKYN